MADNWQLKAILSAVDKMSPVLKQIGGVAKTTRKYLADVATAASGLTSKIGLPLTALGGVMAGFSGVAIKNAVVSFTELGESIYNASLRTGMSTDQLQRMKYVADQSGVSFEALQGTMGKLNLNLGKAASGQGAHVDGLLKRLGISAKELAKQGKSGIDILPQLADAFKRNQGPLVQSRMGMALFGKTWQEIVPLLAGGAAGIDESLDRFKRLKGVISTEDLKAAKELGDKFKDLSFVTKGFQMTIAKELVPVLSPVVESLVQWAAANKKLIAVEVKGFVRDLVAGLKSIDWKAMIDGVKGFFSGMKFLVDMVGGAKNALIGLFLVMNAGTLMAVGGLLGAIQRLAFGLASLALANPVIALVTVAVGALALAGVWLYKHWGQVSAFFDNFWTNMGHAAGYFLGWIAGTWMNVIGAIPAWFQSVWGQVGEVATSVWNAPRKAAELFFSWILGKIQWAVDLIKGVGNAFGDFFHGEGAGISAGYAATRNDAPGSTRPSLIGSQQVKASGKIEVSFKDAPQGMRVEQAKNTGDVPINTDVGYRSFALGMP